MKLILHENMLNSPCFHQKSASCIFKITTYNLLTWENSIWFLEITRWFWWVLSALTPNIYHYHCHNNWGGSVNCKVQQMSALSTWCHGYEITYTHKSGPKSRVDTGIWKEETVDLWSMNWVHSESSPEINSKRRRRSWIDPVIFRERESVAQRALSMHPGGVQSWRDNEVMQAAGRAGRNKTGNGMFAGNKSGDRGRSMEMSRIAGVTTMSTRTTCEDWSSCRSLRSCSKWAQIDNRCAGRSSPDSAPDLLDTCSDPAWNSHKHNTAAKCNHDTHVGICGNR